MRKTRIRQLAREFAVRFGREPKGMQILPDTMKVEGFAYIPSERRRLKKAYLEVRRGNQ